MKTNYDEVINYGSCVLNYQLKISKNNFNLNHSQFYFLVKNSNLHRYKNYICNSNLY